MNRVLHSVYVSVRRVGDPGESSVRQMGEHERVQPVYILVRVRGKVDTYPVMLDN